MKRTRLMEQVWPALLAALFAQELGLPHGNMWEPGIAKNIQAYLDKGLTKAEVEQGYRIMLGLTSTLKENK